MPINPLDWTAEPFLSLYGTLAGLACLICFFLRERIGRAETLPARLDALQLAYLTGGPQRVADVVALGFMAANAQTAGRVNSPASFGAPLELSPELRPFRNCLAAGDPVSTAFRRAAVAQASGLSDKLESMGLAPTSAEMSSYRIRAAAILFVPLALGIAKAFVGASRDKPIGILIVLLIATGVLAVFLLRPEWSTPAGRQALEKARMNGTRAARAPLNHELMLAVALTGTVVLTGTAYAQLHEARQSSSGGDGGGGGCGGGGGGCGGCGS
jgi:uncharacterized protein (TIGR04222 family)